MWDSFDTTMRISMVVTVISLVLMLLQEVFDIGSSVYDFLFPSEPTAT